MSGSFFKAPAYDYFVGIVRSGVKNHKGKYNVAFADGIWKLTAAEIFPHLLPESDRSDIRDVMFDSDMLESLIVGSCDDEEDDISEDAE